MSTSDIKRLATFVAVLAFITVVIYGVWHQFEVRHEEAVAKQQRAAAAEKRKQDAEVAEKNRQAALKEKKREAEETARKAAQAAATQHAQYVAKYVNPGITRPAGSTVVAVAAASEDGTMNTAVTSALADRLRSEHAEVVSSLFKPAFVADGLFQQVFDGGGDPLRTLDLTNAVDAVVLAQETIRYAQNAALDNLVTATMQLKVEVLPVTGTLDTKGWTFTARGPGFSKDIARQAAEESLIQQITTNTDMTIGPIL